MNFQTEWTGVFSSVSIIVANT